FFQAEDGIRDATVTGVQTCALPILEDQRRAIDVVAQEDRGAAHARWLRTLDLIEEVIHRDRGLRQESAEEVGSPTPGTHEKEDRSEERRVGKEGGRARGG